MTISKPMTQADFGELVGVSQQAVGALMKRGVLRPGESGTAWLRAYLANAERQMPTTGRAAHPLTVASASLMQTRLRQKRLALAAKRREAAPLPMLQALVEINADIVGRSFALLPAEVAAAVPELDPVSAELLAAALAEVQALVAQLPAELMRRVAGGGDAEDDDEDA